MQFNSAVRLAHLEALHKAKSAAARDAMRRRNEHAAAATAARRAADEAEAEVKREQAATRMGIGERIAERMKGEPQTEDRTAKAARLRARSDELDAALAQADQQAAATRDAATDAGRLLAACTDFARAEKLRLPVSTNPTGADPLAGVQAQGVVR